MKQYKAINDKACLKGKPMTWWARRYISAPKAFLLTLLAPASFKSEWSSMLGSQVQLKKCFLGKYSIMYNLKRHKFLQMSPWCLKKQALQLKKTNHLPWQQLTFHGPARTGGSSAAFGPFLVDISRWSCSFNGLLQGKTSGSFSSGPGKNRCQNAPEKKGRGICAKNKNHWFFKGWCDMFHHF